MPPDAPTIEDLEACRPAVWRTCYRMLGGLADADDATQEALIRAWRALDRFERRSSLSTWLCRIATRVCFDARQRSRGMPPSLRGPGSLDDPLDPGDASWWIEPAPLSAPDEALRARESLSLAWVTATQQLPARQRAALVLMDVLGCSAQEAADALDSTPAAMNSALQRARRALAARGPSGDDVSPVDLAAVQRFAEVFARYDLDALHALLRADAVMSMPPLQLWLRGADAIVAWMGGRGAGCRGSRLVRTEANGAPAWAQYKPSADGGFLPWALVVPRATAGRIAELSFFLDTSTIFPRFGLPDRLD